MKRQEGEEGAYNMPGQGGKEEQIGKAEWEERQK